MIDKLKDIQKKTGSKFTLDEIKREYELCEKDERKTLVNLLKQKGRDLGKRVSSNDFCRGGRRKY